MAEPLKLMYNEPFLRHFAGIVHSAWTPFDRERFVQLVTEDDWERLELKARIRRITLSLGQLLPAAYPEAIAILQAIQQQCTGFPYLFFPDYVEVYGMDDWELSMTALAQFTRGSSAEFAIRPFIAARTEETMARMLEWAGHEDEHVRRLASEGCRPRLPWASALPAFKKDPAPILPILERLKADPSLYVRKSVANNLNDIAKDHPALVLEIAAGWKGTDERTDWIIRHGCRTLIKQADAQVMALFGYADGEGGVRVQSALIEALPERAAIGEETEIRYAAVVRGDADSGMEGQADENIYKLRLELGVDYVKANGTPSRKKFLLKEAKAKAGTRLNGTKRLSWADLSTRKHYPGIHKLVLLVNGQEAASTTLLLTPEAEGAAP
ncbi:3-methyladenine DNA glycosylase AlkC [Paenibacillus phyllosphaerae]|uniref:3-methyladenine DNA glycosylase AlkC n=1 Tax=Paenibacillus phyllosphaerae TaxID=274593 RepID=A0A7W5B2J4_9BACL|nr:DNA alkylation repair protein [Paenibacillus phyllosphaerae]MBB3112681.1 3-methyladenine DNA glycosylase AlkC [Paenibacillus phyllosphaerae]